MTPEQFVEKFYPYAIEVQNETSIPAVAILAQAALESGWGEKAIKNNLFGIKYRKGDKGFIKVLTTEYTDSPNDFKGLDIVEVKFDVEKKKYRYKLHCYFANYDSPKEGFMAHAKLLLSERYKPAMRYVHSPKRFLIAVWRCGYATDPNYGRKMCDMVDSVNRRLRHSF